MSECALVFFQILFVLTVVVANIFIYCKIASREWSVFNTPLQKFVLSVIIVGMFSTPGAFLVFQKQIPFTTIAFKTEPCSQKEIALIRNVAVLASQCNCE